MNTQSIWKKEFGKLSFLLVSIIIASAFLSGCSGVYSGSLTGEIHDQKAYDNGEDGSGIGDAKIFLYLEEEDWTLDYANWEAEGRMPENPLDEDGEETDPKYLIDTVSDNDGVFDFNSILWHEFWGDYGKDGDRKQIFLLFYHEDYGMCQNDVPIYVVSDTTTHLTPLLLENKINEVRIRGYIKDQNKTDENSQPEPLNNVTVNIYVPKDWSYNSGSDTDISIRYRDMPEEPTYSFTTDGNGMFQGTISFPMKPDIPTNRGTCEVIITLSRNNYSVYELSASADTAFLAGTTVEFKDPANRVYFDSGMNDDWDLDNDVYFDPSFSFILDAPVDESETDYGRLRTNTLPAPMHLRQINFNTTISGVVYLTDGTTGTNDATVRVFRSEADMTAGDNVLASATTEKETFNDEDETNDEDGHYTTGDISWTLYNYTEEYATKDVWISVNKSGASQDGTYSDAPAGRTISSGGDNSAAITLVQDPAN